MRVGKLLPEPHNVHHIPQGGCEESVWGEIATNNRLWYRVVLRENIPSSLTRYQKHLTQPAANDGGKISNSSVRKQPELCGRDSGLRKKRWIDEVFSRQMNCAFEEFLLKTFDFFLILHCQKPLQKERGECCPHAGVLKWRSVLKQNSLAKAHHSPVTVGRFTETRRKIKVHLPQMLNEEKMQSQASFFHKQNTKLSGLY